MKNTIKILTILVLVATSFTFTSCNKDDDNDDTTIIGLTGNYQIYLDGALFKEETNLLAGLGQDDQGNFINTVAVGTGTAQTTAVVGVIGFPRTVGDVVTMDSNLTHGVTIAADGVNYGTISGTLTRTSTSKISFDGRCTSFTIPPQEYDITGYVESDAIRIIN